MAWVTKLGADMRQVDYRLKASAGCGVEVRAIPAQTASDTAAGAGSASAAAAPAGGDAQLDYRLEEGTNLRWIGEGLAEFGIEPGTRMTAADVDAARLMMNGQDPSNKDVLVVPKEGFGPASRLDAAPFVARLREVAAGAGHERITELFDSERAVKRAGQLERAVARESWHRAPVRDLDRLADAAGVDLAEVYDQAALAAARAVAEEKVRVGNRGYDLTLDVQKSYSVLHGLAEPALAAELGALYDQAVTDTVAAVESWTAYGMRGRHGDGQSAERIATSGLLGWTMTHQTARPVEGAAPDPHLHAHVALANMARGVDGQWSTIAAGGKDLHRHALAADAYLKARLRHLTGRYLGLAWERDAETGAWEITGIDREVRELYSKRQGQVRAELVDEGYDPDAATVGQVKTASGKSREEKTEWDLAALRENWREQAETAGYDPDALVAAALSRAEAPAAVDAAEIAVQVFHPEFGVTAHRKSGSRAEILAAVADATEAGVADLDELETLTDAVIAAGPVQRLDRDAAAHLSNAARYTTSDIVAAETTILDAARERLGEGAAVVDPQRLQAAIGAFETRRGFTLSDEQRAAVERLTQAGHGLDYLVGAAGTGKTTIMDVAARAWKAEGLTVGGASTAAVAAHHLQTETGIKSATIASWLWEVEAVPTGNTPKKGLEGIDVLVVDEGAMVDDRQMAALVQAAGMSGTKIVSIGDPKQLSSPGVGSTFADVHAVVEGASLLDNRRQRDETHRQALQSWRDDDRRAALDALAQAGNLHAEDTIAEAHSAMIGSWWADVAPRDPWDRIGAHLLMAGTRADVDALNDAAQAIRIDAGELDAATGRDYRLPGGRHVTLHVGDQVMLRINDRDTDRPGPALLNGHRGLITGIDQATGHLTMSWPGRGGEPVWQDVKADYIAKGGLDLAYAITVHKAQGQTADAATVHLTGLEATAAYPALSRHREHVNAWLARDVVEDPEVQARLGTPRSPEEALDRAVKAYGEFVNKPEREQLAIAELRGHGHRLAHRKDAKRPISQKIADAKAAKAAGKDRGPKPGRRPGPRQGPEAGFER